MRSTTKPTADLLDAMPPSDLDAERGVLGSMLLVPTVCDDVTLVLSPSDFYSEANAKLYSHLAAMHEAGSRIDVTLLVNRLRKLEDFERIGGAAYVAEILESVPTAANAVYYAGLVRDAAIKRELIQAGTLIIRTAHDEPEAGEALDGSERTILAIRDKRGSLSSNATNVADLIGDVMAEINARSTERPPWISTGFAEVDRYMSLRKSELTILAARPSMGKSALAMDIAANVAAEGEAALFFSLEMSAAALTERVLSAWAEVDSNRLRRGELAAEDRRKIVEASAQISQLPLVIDDSPSQTVQRMAAVCRRQKRKGGLGLVVIDYLQLIEPDNAREPRQEQVAKISRRLKGLARELEVPVMCLAQLNREVEKRTDPRPRLSDLRESGAIEQDADVIAFVHRPEYYDASDESKRGKAEVIVSKVRNGPTGVAKLLWRSQYTSFRPLAVYDAENYQHSFDEFNQAEAF